MKVICKTVRLLYAIKFEVVFRVSIHYSQLLKYISLLHICSSLRKLHFIMTYKLNTKVYLKIMMVTGRYIDFLLVLTTTVLTWYLEREQYSATVFATDNVPFIQCDSTTWIYEVCISDLWVICLMNLLW